MITQRIKFIDGLLLSLNLLLTTLIVFILKFGVPEGSGSGATFMYVYRSEWLTVHYWLSLALCVFAIIYIALEWKWIVTMFKFHFGNPKDL